MTWALIVGLLVLTVIRVIIGRPIEPEDRVLVLRALSAGPMTVGDIQKMTGLPWGNLYAILYGKETKGEVASEADDTGRRKYWLTMKGTQVLHDSLQ